jgi:hypothetical protein
MSISLDHLPPDFSAVWGRLRDDMVGILGDDLVALWAFGARTFPNPPRSLGDFDTFAVLRRRPRDETIQKITDAHAAIEQEHRVSLDTDFILLLDAVQPGFPPPAWGQGRDEHWAFHQAHWHAGRYLLLHGKPAEEVVPPATWSDLLLALRLELEHLERHVAAGDNDPYEASYAVFNGVRILYGLETRDVVISKRAAGAWALENLPDRWHAALLAAGRAYDGEATAPDVEVLRAAMAPLVAMVRARLDSYLATHSSELDSAASS